jgi:hypothetical protein
MGGTIADQFTSFQTDAEKQFPSWHQCWFCFRFGTPLEALCSH